MRLFVDCDDTLIMYDTKPHEDGCHQEGCVECGYTETHPYGVLRGQPFRLNESLIEYIKAFRGKYPASLIIIWSGGGKEYAQHIANVAGLDDLDIVALDKDRGTFGLVAADDIVVDDMALRGVAAAVTPPDFFDNKDNWGL